MTADNGTSDRPGINPAHPSPTDVRPANPRFSSGPCAKRPGWTPEALLDAALGRSHRAKIGKAKLKPPST
jgi:phosphoserine aminotransferase